jgi:glyoxalase family protein
LSVPDLKPTHQVLDRIGLREVRTYAHPESAQDQVHVYEMGPGGVGAELHVAVQPSLPIARGGAGGVHHVAFRIPDSDYDLWADSLNTWGIRNSGKVDRHWFRSLYFREPNGILFEIATDGPGFGVDEDPATLGEKIVLAPFLEPHRAQIEAGLKPID